MNGLRVIKTAPVQIPLLLAYSLESVASCGQREATHRRGIAVHNFPSPTLNTEVVWERSEAVHHLSLTFLMLHSEVYETSPQW